METIVLSCQRCPRRQVVNAPTPQRGWDRALAAGWGKFLKTLLCPAENPARVEYAKETRTHA